MQEAQSCVQLTYQNDATPESALSARRSGETKFKSYWLHCHLHDGKTDLMMRIWYQEASLEISKRCSAIRDTPLYPVRRTTSGVAEAVVQLIERKPARVVRMTFDISDCATIPLAVRKSASYGSPARQFPSWRSQTSVRRRTGIPSHREGLPNASPEVFPPDSQGPNCKFCPGPDICRCWKLPNWWRSRFDDLPPGSRPTHVLIPSPNVGSPEAEVSGIQSRRPAGCATVIVKRPKGMRRRRRLNVEHVDRRAGNLPFLPSPKCRVRRWVPNWFQDQLWKLPGAAREAPPRALLRRRSRTAPALASNPCRRPSLV